MVRGVGVDIVEIARIGQLISRYGDHFTRKVFTDSEIRYCSAAARPEIHFSGRWAAKEAFYKALPSSCQPLSHWKSIEVLPEESSDMPRRPCVRVVDVKLQAALELAGIRSIHLSISHERTHCVAFVLAE